MFCTQCGKKLKDTMLFCPNCGAPIEILDDDEDVVAAAPAKASEAVSVERKAVSADVRGMKQNVPAEDEAAKEMAAEPAPEPVREDTSGSTADALFTASLETEAAEEDIPVVDIEEVFVPLAVADDKVEAPEWEKIEPVVERRPPVMRSRDENAVRLDGHAPRMKSKQERAAEGKKASRDPKPQQARAARTYVPSKPMDPDDMFMDAPDPFDEFEDMEFEDLPDDDFEYEDDVEGSFVLRHIRGIMGFSLMALLALVCLIYVSSQTGQAALAKLNLAWKPEVYSKVAYEYYENGLYEMSGSFYEKALARDTDNYNYAISAASAYIYGEETEKAASMLKKSIAIDPSRPEPYIYLLNIYPDAASRPWDVTQLLQQGYGRTGDDRLKSVAP